MNTLDRYFLREWIKVFGITVIGFPLVVIVFDVTDRLGMYLGRGLSRGTVALSYVFSLPETIFLVLPAAVPHAMSARPLHPPRRPPPSRRPGFREHCGTTSVYQTLTPRFFANCLTRW